MPKLLLSLCLMPVLYWTATAGMIEYSARYLSTSPGCCVLFSFNHSGYLLSQGMRAVPAMKRQIAKPGVGLGHKIHFAWLLCRMGDYSQFPIFINGLNSSSQKFIAAARMQDFPDQCHAHLPAILAGAIRKQHERYWDMLMLLAERSNLTNSRKESLMQDIADFKIRNKELNAKEIVRLRQGFGV